MRTTLRRFLRRRFRGLWLSRPFRMLWGSLTTPMQMGVLVALETLPFALVSLHAGVLLDRVRKLPVVIVADVTRCAALLAIPLAAWFGALSIELLFIVGFFCGVQNVVGGAAYQVLLAQLAGRRRLVEANAKTSLGETGSALVGPGLAGGLIQLLTAPFAIALDALAFLVSALMLRTIRVPSDVPHRGPRSSVTAEIADGLRLVAGNRTLRALAAIAAAWQVLHHMQLAVLVLFATRVLELSPGAIGLAYACGGFGCLVAASFAERLARRYGVGASILLGLILTVVGWQALALVSGPAWFAGIALGAALFVFDFGGVLWGINYLALRQAITPDRLLGRMTATMRFLTVAAAPLGSLAGGAIASAIGLRMTLLAIAALGVALAIAAVAWSPVRRHRTLPVAIAE
jgi:MFS family permease